MPKDLVENQAALVRRKAELREQKDGQYRHKYAVLQERMKELDKVRVLVCVSCVDIVDC